MKYHISTRSNGRPTTSTVITYDNVVVWATPAFKWTVGLDLGFLMRWLNRKGLPIACVGAECEAPAE